MDFATQYHLASRQLVFVIKTQKLRERIIIHMTLSSYSAVLI